MLDYLGLEAVEITHLARLNVRGADCQARLVALDEREIDELFQRVLKRSCRVIARVLGPERNVRAEEGEGVRREEAGQDLRLSSANWQARV